MSVIELQDIIDSSDTEDELLDSHLNHFQFVNEDGENTLSPAYVTFNHMLRAPQIIIFGLTSIFHASMGWTGYING